jgi:EF hand
MRHLIPVAFLFLAPAFAQADTLDIVKDVEGQPLGQNATRLLQALDFLGTPLAKETADAIEEAAKARDAVKIQKLLDPHVLLSININPESRVKVARGPAEAAIQQHGFTPVVIKIFNDSTVKKALHMSSPQSGPRQKTDYNGVIAEIKKKIEAKRISEKDGELQIAKLNKEIAEFQSRFLQVEMFTGRPMTGNLSGLKCEYALALVYSNEAGKREATISFDVGQGTQDLGFRAELPVLFDIKPAVEVKLSIEDFDGRPTVGRFTFRDKQGRVYPLRGKRLAPDLFFQDQVYRADGGVVLLPPGELVMTYSRGPEYKQMEKKITVTGSHMEVPVKLERWVNTMEYGFYGGDHHIHAAGCAHYTVPTEGVTAADMFLHVKGEGLNVGCNLTWGPCFEYQRQYFEPHANKLSEPFCVLKYDLEISGFGSQAMGHVCLLNLKDQTYPGSDGTKERGWPKWTTPVMKWTKDQGGFAGYAHSGSGLMFDPPGNAAVAARGIVKWLDANNDGHIDQDEAKAGVIPEAFAAIDANADGVIDEKELLASINRTKNKLPNLAIPPMNGIGAQEICVTTAMGVCDFISAMDTARVPEWNCWYHIMNCGFPLKASGETDFPCISGSRVGEGRVYVQMGKLTKIDYSKWCEGLAKGRSYVSDGYAHALDFRVNDTPLGGELKLDQPGMVKVKTKVAFASSIPLGTAKGGQVPAGNKRLVELIVNGKVADSINVPADDQTHDLEFNANIDRSSWVAIRQFPQMHTNPINVIVAGKPIRASKQSALWCLGVIDQLWRVRGPDLPADERVEARKTFDKAIAIYRKILEESNDETK